MIEVLEQLMDYEEIINICEQLLPEYSQDFNLLEAKISALMGLKLFKNAVNELKKLAELSDETSNRIWVYNNWAYRRIKKEDFQQA